MKNVSDRARNAWIVIGIVGAALYFTFPAIKHLVLGVIGMCYLVWILFLRR